MEGFQYKYGDQPLEGYTIQRGLGRGGFGEVYYAVSDSGREVALKAVQGYEQIELRGISQCMNLKSPHLVTIFNVRYNDHGRPFVIMEYVAGPSLRQLLDESPSGLGEQKAAFFLREIGKGLTFLHDRGIVHRDLKPGNIFYEDGYVQIGDYGLSKAISPTANSGQTVTVGTVHYMAPEIGAGHYDKTIDIYALGTLLYEMLTGQVPFFGGSVGEILMKHMAAEPEMAEIGEPFATVVGKAMAKDPADRYQTVQEMVEAVFGAAHIRQSVSHFSPDSLSVVAKRVATRAKVAAGGPGGDSSSGSSVGAGRDGDSWQGFDAKMERFGRKMGRLSHVLDRLSALKTKRQGEAAVQVRRDLVTRGQRMVLFAVAAVSVAGAIGVLAPGELPRNAILALMTMIGASAGIAWGQQRLFPRLANEKGTVVHLAFGGLGCAGAIALGGPFFLATYSPSSVIGPSWGAVLVALFFVDWKARTQPERGERVSLDHAVSAGLFGLVLAYLFGGSIVFVIGLLGGLSLGVEALSPAGGVVKPATTRKRRWHRRETPHDAGATLPTHRHARPPSRAAVPTLGPRQVSAFVRVLWLMTFVALLTTGVMLLVWAGIDRLKDDEYALAVAFGLGSLMFSIFCLVKACRKTFRSRWSSLYKPLLMLMCVQSIIVACTCLGGMRLGKDETLVAAFFIVFPSILFIVLAAISGRAFRSGRRARRARKPVPPLSSVSPYRRMWAMLLTAGLFFGVGGLHRFYVGKIGTGVLWLVTGGGFLIGQIVDVILIAMGQFRDEQGRLLITWENDNELDMPLRETPAGVEHAEPIRETADGESPESVEDESAVAEADSNVWHASSAVRSVVSPRQTNWVLAGVGRLILLAAILIGLAWAANVAGMIQGGMIPGLGEELSDDVFGTPAWPQIVQRLGWAATVIVTLLAAAVLVMARQGAGFVHMLRAVVGVGTLLGAIYSLNNALHAISWFAVIGSFRAEQTGAAIEMALNQVHGDDAVLAAVLFLASIFILAWPERRERRFLAELGGEGDG